MTPYAHALTTAIDTLKWVAERSDDEDGVRNAYVVVIVNTRTENIAAMRFRVFDTKTNEPSAAVREVADGEKDRRSFEEQGRAYARSLGWSDTDTTLRAIGPLTADASQWVYDVIPGGRITIPQADKLFNEMAKSKHLSGVVNLRRATDKNADN